MSYDSTELSRIDSQYDGSWSLWAYRSTDSLLDVMTPGYISDAGGRYMRQGDSVFVITFLTQLLGLYVVAEVNANGAATLELIAGGSPSTTLPPVYHTALSDDTYIIPARTTRLILTPAGTLATLSLDMSIIAPIDGQVFELSTTQQITELTLNGETFLLNANSGASWVYRASNATWYARY